MNNLSAFNQQVITCQDEAYTLAWYLLGDDTEAERVVQAAVVTAFPLFSPNNRASCRSLVLGQVLRLCMGRDGNPASAGISEVAINLHSLSDRERQAIVLIEILRLDYCEASMLLQLSNSELARLLAQARRKLVHTEPVQRKEFA